MRQGRWPRGLGGSEEWASALGQRLFPVAPFAHLAQAGGGRGLRGGGFASPCHTARGTSSMHELR